MHHSNRNLSEFNGIDAQQDGHDGSVTKTMPSASQKTYLYNQFLQADSSDVVNAVQDTHVVSANDQNKKTLFNIRLTSLGKRLSDRLESENEEPDYIISVAQKPSITGGKKSRNCGHVTFENVPETKAFEFVHHKATTFNRSASSSDFNLEELSDDDNNEEDDSDNFEDVHSSLISNTEFVVMFQPLGTSKIIETSAEKDPETTNTTVSDGQSEHHSHLFNKSKSSPSSQRKQRISLLNKTEQSSLLDQPANVTSLQTPVDSSLLPEALCDNDTQKNRLSSLTRTEVEESSAIDSAFKNKSENIDNGFISHTVSDDVVAECSQESKLSEDASPPAEKTVTIIVAEKEEEKPEVCIERSLLEHSLQLNVAFNEFVEIEGFRASVQNRKPHTENSFVAKYEKQLEIVLKDGSSKGLKAYLRNSQWPAESGKRWRMWENLCNHLLKAEEHLYHKLVNDMLSHDEEGWTLPSFVETDCMQSYFLTAHGLEHAKTVVSLLSHLHPDITYCPILYPMSCLFLHYMSPEACFNCMQALLRSTRSCYFLQTQIKSEACKYVLRDLTKKYAKQAYELMGQSSDSVEAVFDNWMGWIFRDLPFQYLVRIVDSFLFEGYKIFYRISLAVVILFAKEYSKHGNQNTPGADISAEISRFCQNMSIDPRRFIQVGFGIRGLSRKEISKLHDRNETYLTSLPTKVSKATIRLRELVPSAVLTPDMLQSIWQWIPVRLSLMKPTLVFSSNEHGTAIRTLYTRTEHAPQTILAIKTTSNEIFGAFCSSPWYTRHEKNKPKTSFFGTGETFVFSFSPMRRRYPWTGLLADPPERVSDLFMAGDDQMLVIGSGNGTAIYLDAMMNRCSSTRCETFDNDPLCSHTDFSCRVVEVFAFTE